MKSSEVRRKYLDFFKAPPRNHVEIPSAPLIPENDPTTLFTSSGMQPLVPYLLGQPHPAGKRLVNSQKSFRAQDIDEVGDTSHTTFFEMLGNWSLGDYFKKEQLPWIWEFLTEELGLSKEKLFISIFEGTKDVPRDEESARIWKSLGATEDRMFYYGVDKNWWSRAGEPDFMPAGEPGGPDSEVFFDFGQELGLHEKSLFKSKTCHPNCQCGRFLEIANSVFMQYQKQADGSLKELKQKSVDFGGGLERLVAATNNDPDIFTIDFFFNAIKTLEAISKSGLKYKTDPKPFRIITDHLRAAIFMVSDGVEPSNKERGYVLRRLIRRAMLYARKLNMQGDEWLSNCLPDLVVPYLKTFPELDNNLPIINETITQEVDRFRKTIEKGLKIFEEYITFGEVGKPETRKKMLSPRDIFFLYETYGFPYELTKEEAEFRNIEIPSKEEFDEVVEEHREQSRTISRGMFKGGLTDTSEQTTKLHTAHHLLLASLQKIVDPNIKQRGSNITAERLRMDFNFTRKVTPEELKKVEELVNKTITENLPVTRVEMSREEAEKVGAQMEFGHKYPDRVSVYFVGPARNASASVSGGPQKDFFSAEFCGGPHVRFTAELGRFTITKEESAGSGIRRIYATIAPYEVVRSVRKSSSPKI